MNCKFNHSFSSLYCLIFLFTLSNQFELNAQQSLILNYPVSKVIPDYILPSRNDAMGLIELALRDTLRDISTHPSEVNLINKSLIFLSFTDELEKYSFNSFREFMGKMESEDDQTKTINWTIPLGGIFKYDKFSFGGIFSYSNQSFSTSANTHNISKSSKFSGRNYYYNTIAGYQLNENLGFGAELSIKKYKNEYDALSGLRQFDVLNSNEYLFGVSYSISDKDFLSISSLNYLIDYENTQELISSPNYGSKFPKNYKGWAFQADYTRKVSSLTQISGRIHLDLRKIKQQWLFEQVVYTTREGEAINWRFGFGITHQIENINIAGEIFYEPGRNNVQFVQPSGTWDPFITGNDDIYYNWRIRLGVNIKILDLFNWQWGVEYFSEKWKRIREWDYMYSQEIYPYWSASHFSLTTGLDIKIDQFYFVYCFIYKSYTKRNWTELYYWDYLELMEINPIQHRFLITFEL